MSVPSSNPEGWQPPTAPQQHPKKRRRWPWILGGVVGVLVVIGVAAGVSGGGSTGTSNAGTTPAPVVASEPSTPDPAEAAAPVEPAAPVVPTADKVTYAVSGHAAGLIDLVVPGTVQQQQITTTTDLPWSKSFTVDEGLSEFDFLSISAQNAGSGTISCSISVNGKVVAHNSSSGPYAIADCSTS